MLLQACKNLSNSIARLEKRHAKVIPYVWGVLGVVIYTSSNLFVKSLSSEFSASQLLFYRSLQIFIYTVIFMSVENMEFYYNSSAINKLLQIRGMAGTIGIGLTYYALGLLPLSDATVLSQVYPVMTGILAVFVLNEKYEWSQLLSAMVCIVGVLLVAQPPFLFGNEGSQTIDSNTRILGTILLIIAGFTTSVVEVLVRKLGSKTNIGLTTLIFSFQATLISAFVSIFQGFKPMNWDQMVSVFLIGAMSFVSQMIRNRAFMLGNAGRVSNTAYFGIVSSYILDVFILGTKINVYSLLGAFCILSCLFIYILQIYYKEKKGVKA